LSTISPSPLLVTDQLRTPLFFPFSFLFAFISDVILWTFLFAAFKAFALSRARFLFFLVSRHFANNKQHVYGSWTPVLRPFMSLEAQALSNTFRPFSVFPLLSAQSHPLFDPRLPFHSTGLHSRPPVPIRGLDLDFPILSTLCFYRRKGSDPRPFLYPKAPLPSIFLVFPLSFPFCPFHHYFLTHVPPAEPQARQKTPPALSLVLFHISPSLPPLPPSLSRLPPLNEVTAPNLPLKRVWFTVFFFFLCFSFFFFLIFFFFFFILFYYFF